jgi:hypothetical protein
MSDAVVFEAHRGCSARADLYIANTANYRCTR